MKSSGICPLGPADLLASAITTELFDTASFKTVLAVLQQSTRNLATESFSTASSLHTTCGRWTSTPISAAATELAAVLSRLHRAISFSRWQKEHKTAVNTAVLAVITKKNPSAQPITDSSPLGVKLVTLSDTVKGVAPANAALEYCARMSKALKLRRAAEARIGDYEVASAALADVMTIGTLAQMQVEGLRANFGWARHLLAQQNLQQRLFYIGVRSR